MPTPAKTAWFRATVNPSCPRAMASTEAEDCTISTPKTASAIVETITRV